MTALTHDFMEVNGLRCQINLPDAPEGEGIHNLPPHAQRPVYKVDEFPACPTNWMHGSDKASSYFFPVGKGKHMWFDFNVNRNHSHHIAIVLSVQGINPITGQQSKVLRLEQYREKCPVHTDVAFKQDRFCEKCDFKWPSQNYMTTATGEVSRGLLWIDGWRTAAETVRGFLITAETMKGIATQIIGEDRVWAIGIAFYLSKEPKPPKPAGSGLLRSTGMSFNESSPHKMHSYGHSGQTYSANVNNVTKGSSMGGMSSAMPGPSGQSCGPAPNAGYDEELLCSFEPGDDAEMCSAVPASASDSLYSSDEIKVIETEKLEIAAGAQIKQELAHHDPNDLDFYEEEPAGVIYSNYCSLDDFEKIIAAGARDMTKGGEGALHGLNVGNSAK